MAKGKADVKIDAPAHSKGIRMGNAKGNWLRQPGHLPDGTSTAEKSTGIDPKGRQPIDPRMPNLPPA
jgi:hypothetical protein